MMFTFQLALVAFLSLLPAAPPQDGHGGGDASPNPASVEWVVRGVEPVEEPLRIPVNIATPYSATALDQPVLDRLEQLATREPRRLLLLVVGRDKPSSPSSATDQIGSPAWISAVGGAIRSLTSRHPDLHVAIRLRDPGDIGPSSPRSIHDEAATAIVASRWLIRQPAPTDPEIAAWATEGLRDDAARADGRPIYLQTPDGWWRIFMEPAAGAVVARQPTSPSSAPFLLPLGEGRSDVERSSPTDGAAATLVGVVGSESTSAEGRPDEGRVVPEGSSGSSTTAGGSRPWSSGPAMDGLASSIAETAPVSSGLTSPASSRGSPTSRSSRRGVPVVVPTGPATGSPDLEGSFFALDPWAVDEDGGEFNPGGQDATGDLDPNPSGSVVPDEPVTPSGSGAPEDGLAERGWGPTHLDDGRWLKWEAIVTPDSRVVYVAADGDDALAASVRGRGHYVAGDPEIGPNPTRPSGSVQAYRTYAAAIAQIRSGAPDWLLFRRGDTFAIPETGLSSKRGAGPNARCVVAAFGSESIPRPRLVGESGATTLRFVTSDPTKPFHAIVSSLDMPNGFARLFGARDVWLEDLRLATIEIIKGSSNIRVRRCAVIDAYRADGGHVQGMFLGESESILIEECVFDRGGYKQDPNDPSTWTAKVQSFNSKDRDALPVGRGVQPHRNWFCRNLYLSSYRDLSLRGNLIARGGSGSVQMRVGGIAERNVWIWNDQAIAPITQGGREYLHGMTVADNLVLHDDHFVTQAKWGAGITIRAGTGDRALLQDNIFAHFHRGGDNVIAAGGISDYKEFPHQQGDGASIVGNTVCMKLRTRGVMVRGVSGVWGKAGMRSVDFERNDIAFLSPGVIAAVTESARPAEFRWGDASERSNRWLVGSGSRFELNIPVATAVPFASWQAGGWDVASQSYSTLESLAWAAGWRTAPDAQGRRGWERDIVSYMQSIDPSYVVDESVTVDEAAPASRRRSDAPQVWRVLHGLVGQSNNLPPMTEDDAKLTARRYHAFLRFIERARANRRGAWDPRYAADALNNYIRVGFGKAPVGGAYSATLPEDSQ